MHERTHPDGYNAAARTAARLAESSDPTHEPITPRVSAWPVTEARLPVFLSDAAHSAARHARSHRTRVSARACRRYHRGYVARFARAASRSAAVAARAGQRRAGGRRAGTHRK
ncbi:hypothetical protein BURKHO8Y_10205 [Burkholderia sp. 8Y]|nr:hypothetical protein BURKHO8Y_10205 [Burkholderia sp. 8Y]